MHKKLGLALALAASFLSMTPTLASAADVVPMRNGERQESVYQTATVSATANYTNATTTATDIPGATVTFPASNHGDLSRQFYRVCYSADLGKATSTYGQINLVVNGTTVSDGSRQINFNAGRGANTLCYVGARPTNASYIVKLQGVSGDTATFTVYNLQMTASSFYAR